MENLADPSCRSAKAVIAQASHVPSFALCKSSARASSLLSRLWNPFIKEACGCVCLLVNAYYTRAGAGWLAETAARNQPCITESAHPEALAHLCPGEAGLGPHHTQEGGASRYQRRSPLIPARGGEGGGAASRRSV